MKKYHLIAGLPRSGSTLLSSILNQNPRFHAGISNPLQYYVKGIVDSTHNDFGYRTTVNDEMFKKIIAGLFDNFYFNVEKEICFNTGRSWPTLFHTINTVFPQTKVICTVRDVVEVVNSFELLYLKNPFQISTMYGPYRETTPETSIKFYHATVYSRAMHIQNFIDSSLMALQQMYHGPYKKHMLLIEYDDLCANPKLTIDKLYDFLEEPRFNHDFNNVESDYDEYDMAMSAKGLHKVKRKVELAEKNLILPTEIVNRMGGKEFWRKSRFTS